MRLRFLGLLLLTLTTSALAQVKDTDGDGLLDLMDVPGFSSSASGEINFRRLGIEDLDGAKQLTNATSLDLGLNPITSIENGDFEGLDNLQELYLWHTQITSIESDAFEGLTNLQRLVLIDNPIRSIESGAFEGLTNLQNLVLNDTQITNIENGDFEGLDNLRELNLSGRAIRSIESGAFEGLTNLQNLVLNDTQITNIESSAFEGLTNLQRLNLYTNQITSIESGAFRWAAEMETLGLGGNPLKELNLEGARFDSLSRFTVSSDHDSHRITSLVLDDAKLSTTSFDAIAYHIQSEWWIGARETLREASFDGLTISGEPPRYLSRLLGIEALTTVTVDPWLHDMYADEFAAFDATEGKSVTITPKDCNGDEQVSILDANCISVNRLDNLLEDYGTVRGDLDGVDGVAFADFLAFRGNYGMTDAVYTQGDFDKDGTVGFADFLILSANYGHGGDFTNDVAAVPEPSSVALLLVGILLLFHVPRTCE